MLLRDKTILITGASSGLGRALAIALSKQGNRIVATARRESLLRELTDEIEASGGQCVFHAVDATDPTSGEEVLAVGIAAFGRIDVAVLNAGGAAVTNMSNASAERVREVMRVNYDTLANFLCPTIEHMRGVGGIIAYTGSPAGYFGLPKSGPYSAAKAAGRMLFDTCRIELAGSGISFVALYPGFTYTEGLVDEEVPIKALIINKDRAVGEMIWAMERRKAHHMFPKRIRFLMTLARMAPEPLRRAVLQRFV